MTENKKYKSDIEIAREAKLQRIVDIAEKKLNIPEKFLEQYGQYKTKLNFDYINTLEKNKNGKLILVTAITPTPAGEGKTTTTLGLGDALRKIGKNSSVCIREPSLGPCFGMKGGAAGGGKAQAVPMEDLNLHFTGDFHAISTAHNLLSAAIDNHINWRKEPLIDARRVSWKRTMDMNDRALRQIVCSIGGPGNGYPREDGFNITPASEIMAIFTLANDIKDLERRLGNILVGYTSDKEPVLAKDLKVIGSMLVLLKDAIKPNIIQSLENNPVFVHGGPFGNIAHGCNTIIATKTALKISDYVVTEAGFGADLGAEKFLDIKCRKANLSPDASILVATIRALKMHGGVDKDNLNKENVEAVKKGSENLLKHIENLKKYGVPIVVGINAFVSDTEDEMNVVKNVCEKVGIKAITSKHWEFGGDGAVDLAKEVVDVLETTKSNFKTLYEDNISLEDKIKKVANEIYGAKELEISTTAKKQLNDLKGTKYEKFPVCIAKTQYSFTADPENGGLPQEHNLPIKEIRISAGAEFIVVICGDIMLMPGLPKTPAAESIYIDQKGLIQGLF
ncbi:MAG: Formate--tetrahydrofolate ligase [Alphaproteobacteria bacterium MarineAlpha6_Bin6]|nr:formate--tetrahydrofolate ligase [Pelagibacteraceae bacterium]PPR29995.1 MAG: Formate--tetrahydrofolate ligase [Alphaproteobacteria bacterium MarineAlpha6_Bin6]PPR33216.1 MAG: Formate--tetrahydrofolate ligase [Alphaproteobacteria bacterium MarineAlpha6_Bin5]|tara:strand:+ start:18180 stop:19871 length:1692 start_codon:yes stop_codon:yes gene_type:complete